MLRDRFDRDRNADAARTWVARHHCRVLQLHSEKAYTVIPGVSLEEGIRIATDAREGRCQVVAADGALLFDNHREFR